MGGFPFTGAPRTVPPMNILRVGAPFEPGVPRWPELSHYAWDPAHAPASHHRLTVFAASPTARERVAFRSGGRLELALIVDGPVILLLWTGAGWPWSDAPYSWHLQAARAPLGVPDTSPVPTGAGVPMDAILVDAATGLVAAIRTMAMPGSYATALHRAIYDQAALTWDPRAYDARVQSLAAEPCETLVTRATARCAVGR